MSENPPPDVLSRGVPQDSVREQNAHPPSWLEPVQTAFNKEDFWGGAGLKPTGIPETAVVQSFPDMRQVKRLQDMAIGDRDLRAEGGIGHHDIHAPERNFLNGACDIL